MYSVFQASPELVKFRRIKTITNSLIYLFAGMVFGTIMNIINGSANPIPMIVLLVVAIAGLIISIKIHRNAKKVHAVVFKEDVDRFIAQMNTTP